MTADEFWRAERFARETVVTERSAPLVSEVGVPATAPPPGEVVVRVAHVGAPRVGPPSGESSAIPPSGVVADEARPEEDPVVPPLMPAPVKDPAVPAPPRKDRKRRTPSSYSLGSKSYSTEDDLDDEESRSRPRGTLGGEIVPVVRLDLVNDPVTGAGVANDPTGDHPCPDPRIVIGTVVGGIVGMYLGMVSFGPLLHTSGT